MAFSFSPPSPFQSSQFYSFAQPQQQFQFPQQQQQQQPQQNLQALAQPQQQQQQQQLLFYTAAKTPASYSTKLEELHPDSQKLLQQIEERILEYKDESERLDQCSRLYDASVTNDSFELDASRILQELGVFSSVLERERVPIQELMNTVNQIMWNTEIAIRSYMMLRSRFLHSNVSPTSNSSTSQTGAAASNQATQPVATTMGQIYDFYNGLPKRPSTFMQQTVTRFEKYLNECFQWIEELEQLLRVDNEKESLNLVSSLSQSIPTVMNNLHDYFIHLAAKVESLHQYIESMRIAYLADRRRRGETNDPFVEADRRETARQEAAARRVHPTIHLPPVSPQPSTQVVGLISSTPALSSASSQQPLGSATPSPFTTPSITPSASTSSFLYSTPAASAPSLSLFGSSGASPQSTAFGTASPSLFGSVPTPSMFGSSTPAFASNPATGSSLFSTPTLGGGAATGSGASFGASSRSTRPKLRTSRR